MAKLLSLFELFVPELASRLTIAYIFIESGIGKIKNIPQVTAYFESLHIPYPALQAPFVSVTELIAGALIAVGFCTRWAALVLMGVMTVAILTAKLGDINTFSDLLGMSEFLYILTLLWLFARGSRVLSIDSLRSHS